ncbi:hypothetical protein [Sphingobium algorifonticola]|uniref:Uncharacterized protein n=1 Tax=Sphingobium algorifonticola TaxID=2008318 RepID=A0A437J8J7_9SPHN|nr:hypothetical protein [Sphingobium algorifonticola]RVT41827.1 hypothetical protein ENE74_06025 [Sphingobium algorifonticola]
MMLAIVVIVATTIMALVIGIAASKRHEEDRKLLIQQTLNIFAARPQERGLLWCIHPILAGSGRAISTQWLLRGQSFGRRETCRTIIRLHEPKFYGPNAIVKFNFDCGPVCGSSGYMSFYRRKGQWHLYRRFTLGFG